MPKGATPLHHLIKLPIGGGIRPRPLPKKFATLRTTSRFTLPQKHQGLPLVRRMAELRPMTNSLGRKSSTSTKGATSRRRHVLANARKRREISTTQKQS